MSTKDFPPLSGHITYDPDTLMRWLNLVGQALNIDDHVEVVSPSASDEVDIFNVASGKRRKLKLSNLPFTLGAITPTSVAASGTVTGSNLSGTNTGDQTITVLGTPVVTTSGTSIDFTGFPADTKHIAINFVNFSTNGTSDYLVQIGDAGGSEATGYLSTGTFMSSGVTTTAYTTGFGIPNPGPSAATVIHGQIVLSLENSTSNTWVATGVFGESDAARTIVMAGSKSLSPGPLDRVRITTVGGVNTCDAGEVNVAYQV